MRSNKTLLQIAVYGLVCVVILALPLVIKDDFLLNRIDRYLVLAMVSMALSLSWGYAGILNLGQATSFGIGSYCMAMAPQAQNHTGPHRLRRSSRFHGLEQRRSSAMVLAAILFDDFRHHRRNLDSSNFLSNSCLVYVPRPGYRRVRGDHHVGDTCGRQPSDHRPAMGHWRLQRHYRPCPT